MGRAESQILVTHSLLTNFNGWSGKLHHGLHLVTLPIVIKKLVNWQTKKLYGISRLSCYEQYFLLMHSDQLPPTFRLTLTNFLFWVWQSGHQEMAVFNQLMLICHVTKFIQLDIGTWNYVYIVSEDQEVWMLLIRPCLVSNVNEQRVGSH